MRTVQETKRRKRKKVTRKKEKKRNKKRMERKLTRKKVREIGPEKTGKNSPYSNIMLFRIKCSH